MFKMIWEFIFRKLPIVKALDGHKTKISALLLVFTYVFKLVMDLAGLFPEYVWLGELGVTLSNLNIQLIDTLTAIGWGGLAFGIADKEVKKDQ